MPEELLEEKAEPENDEEELEEPNFEKEVDEFLETEN